jgi:DNA-binding transcriptional MocR family regulator
MVLADYAGPTWKCWPSIKTLAQDCEMTERAVIMSLNELERRGFIERVRRGNQHLPSSYLLNRTSQTSLPGNRSPKALAAEDEQVKFPPSASEINNGANEAHFTVGTTEKDRSEESIEQVEQQLTSFFPNPEVDKLFHRALNELLPTRQSVQS